MECGSFHRFFHCFSLNPLKYPLSGDDITGETKNPQKVKTCIVKDDNRYGQQNRTGKEETMSVNGVTSTQAAAAYSYSSTSAAKEKTSAEEAKTTTTAEDTGVIYEHSTAAKTSSTKKTYTPDTNLVNKLKADAENRASQLRSLVEQMMGKQANTYGNANDIWSFLRSGNFTVDPATKAQAQADIADDGILQMLGDHGVAAVLDDDDLTLILLKVRHCLHQSFDLVCDIAHGGASFKN